ncbi:hypothetical protein [Vibrio sp. SCSIO 43137]|uniref:hypothetical protein n=1 Tax=Vibrio sp. SCSIO 43137 TaxID=3021011 RepID=UPI0023078682|nr:hypothetical protein [Vibrio sp. SCSIO 43137]WCE28874.1 hypothetical protein PK654_10945 [Vibrio sp. SCSIO 43137]
MLEHGIYSVHIEGNIIIGRVVGSHNEYDVLAATNAFKKAIATFKGEPFGEIIDARDLDGVTPEGFAEIEKYNSWLVEHGIKARAFVVSNTVMPAIVKNRIKDLNGLKTKEFMDVEQAKIWLEQELANSSLCS